MSKRRTREAWQALVEQQRDSGLSGAAFCRENAIGYISFCKWRKRLAEASEGLSGRSPEPGFVDVSSLMGSAGNATPHWDIVLHLGEGMELRLSRHA